MSEQNLIKLRDSLENTLKDIDTILQSNLPYPVLTQFDEGGYTDGYEHKDLVFVESEIDEEEGILLLNFYCEKL
jgi:hypothetical protein